LPRYQAVLFDFDGVLIDSEPVHFTCWRDILAPLGVPLDWETYRRVCVGIADRAMVLELCRRVDPPADFDRVWAVYPRKRALFRERIAARVPIPPATIELVRSLPDYKLAVVSSSGRAEVEPPLESAGIRDAFGAVVCGEDVARLKPAPDPYLEAARRLGARSALVVEDSVAGIASGRAAGFDVLEIRDPGEVAARVLERLRLTLARASLDTRSAPPDRRR